MMKKFGAIESKEQADFEFPLTLHLPLRCRPNSPTPLSSVRTDVYYLISDLLVLILVL
jgi:hypothetical protein